MKKVSKFFIDRQTSPLKDLFIDKLNISVWNDSEIVIIPKPEELRNKLKLFRHDKLHNLQIFSDFDNTLNKNKYRQQIYDTSYGIFKKSDYLSLEFKMNLKLLYSFFYNELEKLYNTKNENFINEK